MSNQSKDPSSTELCFELDGAHFQILPPAAAKANASSQYLRVRPRMSSSRPATPELSQKGQKFMSTHEKATLYRVSSEVEGGRTQDGNARLRILSQQSRKGGARVVFGARVMFVLRSEDKDQDKKKGGEEDKNTSFAQHAILYGPFSHLTDICQTVASWSQSGTPVSVLMSPKPLHDALADNSGFFVVYGPVDPTAKGCPSVPDWERLLQAFGDIVDRHGQKTTYQEGSAIELLTRHIVAPGPALTFSPSPPPSLHQCVMVSVTVFPKSVQDARECVYQVGHLLCLNGYPAVQVELCHDAAVRL